MAANRALRLSLANGSYRTEPWSMTIDRGGLQTATRKVRVTVAQRSRKPTWTSAMGSCGFESCTFRHRGNDACGWVHRTALRVVCLGCQIRNSKHNRYCGGLLIHSSVDAGVSVQVRSVPPIKAK